MGKITIHNAIVTRNPQFDSKGVSMRGAVFFNAPDIFEGEYPLPAFPCFQFASLNGAGLFFVPKVTDEIEVTINVDDPNAPFEVDDIENPEPRYRCMIYSQATDIAEEFKINYPFRMGWKSNSGHIFLFDDCEGKEIVQIFHKIGTGFEFDKEGNWVETVKKSKISKIEENLEYTVKKIKIKNSTGEVISLLVDVLTALGVEPFIVNKAAFASIQSDLESFKI